MKRIPVNSGFFFALLFICQLRLSATANITLRERDVHYIPEYIDPFGFEHFDLNEQLVEQLDFDPTSGTILVGGEEQLTLLRLEKDLTMTRILVEYFDDVIFQQVTFCRKFWIVTVKNEESPLNGRLMIFKRYNPKAGFLEMVQNIPVGGHSPNDIAVSRDCRKILVTVEGPPFETELVECNGKRRRKREDCEIVFNPPGFILKVEFKTSDLCKPPRLTRLGFEGFETRLEELESQGYLYCDKNVSFADDVEPESICLNKREDRAYVTLQENNAIAVIDCKRKGKCEIVDIKGLGFKDFNLAGNGFDASDEDDEINIANWPVKGLRQPDQIECLTIGKKDFVVTANEGAFKKDKRKNCQVKDLDLDPAAFPNATMLQQDENLGELWVSRNSGDMDGDELYEMLFAFGTRDIGFWDMGLNLVAHTGDDFEQLSAELCPEVFNADSEDEDELLGDAFDSESNEKGIEVEALASLKICGGDSYAVFSGYENPGGIFVSELDTKNPTAGFMIKQHVTGIHNKDTASSWKDLFNTRQVSLLHVEALKVVSAKFSPSGKPLLVAGASSAGTVHVYEIDVECDDMSKKTKVWW